jgi:hypothetical protein
MGKGSKGGPTPNDQRSRAMNPQDRVGQMAMDNRAMQINPQTPVGQKSRSQPAESNGSKT